MKNNMDKENCEHCYCKECNVTQVTFGGKEIPHKQCCNCGHKKEIPQEGLSRKKF